MQIYDQILAALKAEYDTPRTYEQMHARSGVNASHICALLNGRKSVAQMSLDTLLKLFPRASISLDGPAAAEVNSHNVAGRDISIGAASPADAVASYKGRLALALSSLDIPGDALASVLRTVARTE